MGGGEESRQGRPCRSLVVEHRDDDQHKADCDLVAAKENRLAPRDPEADVHPLLLRLHRGDLLRVAPWHHHLEGQCLSR